MQRCGARRGRLNCDGRGVAGIRGTPRKCEANHAPQPRVEQEADESADERIGPHACGCKGIQRLDEAAAESPRVHDHLGDDRNEQPDHGGKPCTDQPGPHRRGNHDLAHGRHGREVQYSRDVVLTRVYCRNTTCRVQHDRPQRRIGRENQLGRDSRPESKDRNRHQRDRRNRAKEVDRRHRVAPHRRREPNGETQYSSECQRDSRRQQCHAERMAEVSGELPGLDQDHKRGKDIEWRGKLLIGQ